MLVLQAPTALLALLFKLNVRVALTSLTLVSPLACPVQMDTPVLIAK